MRIGSVDSAAALARRLRLTRPLAFIDLETTGLSCEADRIVEIAVVIVYADRPPTRWSRLVDPERPIPTEATRVHGISDDEVRGQPRFSDIAAELAAVVAGCDFGGFNVGRFDLRMLAAEFVRAGVDIDLSASRVVDAMRIFNRNERRDLKAAVRFYCDREFDNAHRALSDVDATMDVLAAQLARYDLPTDVDGLADYCVGRQPDWLTSDGKIAWRDGAARLTFGRHAGKKLQTLVAEEPDYLRWLIDQNLPLDFVHTVRKALNGEFPESPIDRGRHGMITLSSASSARSSAERQAGVDLHQ